MPAVPGLRAACLLAAGLAAAAVGPASAASPPPVLRCVGEEPFWTLAITETSAALDRMGEGTVTQAGQLDRLDWLPPGWLVWRSGDSDGARPVVAVVRTEACASTMADGPPRTHRVILTGAYDRTVTGCCTLATGVPDRP
jgi:uncharacterized membrane protein